MAMAANAQTESAFLDAEALLGSEATETAVSVAAGKLLCESSSVKMEAAWDDTYKIVGMWGESDAVKALSIDGVTYDCPSGIQGQTNPSTNSLLTGGQNAGAVFKFEVAADGYLYVFSKLSYNKNYYVWEGDVANGKGLAVAYNMTAYTVSDGTKTGYTLPADELGYYSAMGYDDQGNANFSSNTSYDDGTKYLSPVGYSKNDVDYPGIITDGSWTTGNALGVICFPVYKSAGSYFVNACGSKVTCDGFVFIPGATSIAAIDKADATSIASVANASKSSVVYNLLGQRVAADTKGLVIINGKKVIRK